MHACIHAYITCIYIIYMLWVRAPVVADFFIQTTFFHEAQWVYHGFRLGQLRFQGSCFIYGLGFRLEELKCSTLGLDLLEVFLGLRRHNGDLLHKGALGFSYCSYCR